ncbi:MAG: segregation/condensation protein A [Chloroflexi bacterium]|nr:MAG: segregation/condensation protein A [Chloroflexota bacterium]
MTMPETPNGQPTDEVVVTEEPTGDSSTPEQPAAVQAEPTPEVDEGPFQLQLPVFEGPLDLLLHLLDERTLDITEVSLLAVTEQYLSHLRAGDQVSADALVEFISVGARLLLMKSRALLPRDPDAAPPDEEDEDDPQNLVKALQEYRRYKQAADYLRDLEDQHRTMHRRSAAPPEMPLPPGLDGVTLSSLVDLFRKVLERTPDEDAAEEARARQPRAVPRPRVRLQDRIKLLVDRLERDGQLSFLALLGDAPTRTSVIVDFLAVLELIKVRYLRAEQSDAFGDIALVRIEGTTAPETVEIELEG